MIGVKVGKAKKILNQSEHITEILVEINEQSYKALNYNRLTGFVEVGDSLLVNTTAVDLSLGTGGYHFVISNLDKPQRNLSKGGHIIKLRYSPYQLKVFAAEEQDSKYHDVFNEFDTLDRMPIIVGTLHSMLPAIVEVLKFYSRKIKIAYIMTDGAALPIDFSNIVKNLKKQKLIDSTITIGHAFGGDLDCINIYNGLIAAKKILKCDIAVVTMGPGIVGTGTQFGFSGIEQGSIIDAVNNLGGRAIAVPRISFADSRKRHKGISHHTQTVLEKTCNTVALVGIPYFEESKIDYIKSQIENTTIHKKHNIMYVPPEGIMEILQKSNIRMATMGRSLEQDKEYFITAGIAGKLGFNILTGYL
jgi:hypothetical protein